MDDRQRHGVMAKQSFFLLTTRPTGGLDVRRQVIFAWVAATANTSVCVA
jgi:hypothetical protein